MYIIFEKLNLILRVRKEYKANIIGRLRSAIVFLRAKDAGATVLHM